MSLNSFDAPLNLLIKASFQKNMIIIAPHLAAAILVFSLSVFPLWLKLLVFLFIMTSGFYYWRLHLAQISYKSVKSIQQDSAKNWFITTHDKVEKDNTTQPKSVTLLASSFANKYLIVLNYRDINKSYYSIIITPDSISTNKFRHLQLRLNLTNSKKS